MKAIQQLKRPTLAYPKQPTRAQYTDANGDFYDDTFEMAKFAWKEDYKGMKYHMDKYNDNESNAWARIYDQCSPELKNKLEGTSGYANAKSSKDTIKLLRSFASSRKKRAVRTMVAHGARFSVYQIIKLCWATKCEFGKCEMGNSHLLLH